MVRRAGSNRKFLYNGTSFDVAADANFTEIITAFENSLIATSGKNMLKQVKRPTTREGVVLITDGSEREILKDGAESGDNVPMSYTNAAGDTYRCQGQIEIENNETEDNRTTVQILPEDKWSPFLA